MEIVLILTQDSSTVCVERAIRSEIVWSHPMELVGDMGHVESHFILFGDSFHFILFGDSFVSVPDRCMVSAKCTIGLQIILDAPDGTTR